MTPSPSGNVLEVKKKFSFIFKTTDLGICTHCLGIKIERRPSGLFLTERPYVEKINSLAGMQNAKPEMAPLPLLHTLYEVMQELSKAERAEIENIP